ncbi:hypothetical protein SISSUDRAFT_1038969 [Sistotremastrum suecicum HHB10207 ss-3]|uniref:Nucleoporin Pom152 n=1 Tax=Sistotremastrum suecicum HHB10207 ss-3 TaxID=1314776 RepID=A0A166J7J6_9AGAM|nr:hypothetical protein SISSUDRAFT_1038969 [Sistotremastrum suecicum HHB10207 ss-3]
MAAPAPDTQGQRRRGPLIPETFLGLDIPTQRFYVLSFGAVLQALKVFDALAASLSSHFSVETVRSVRFYYWKWALVDGAFIFLLPRLRLPRLSYTSLASCLQYFLILSLNILLFGNWTFLSLGRLSGIWGPDVEYELDASGHKVRLESLLGASSYLQGQHTVLLSPINTVKLNPYANPFCLSGPSDSVLIPIIFNNTRPAHLKYNHTLPSGASKIVDISTKSLVQPAQAHLDEDDDEDTPRDHSQYTSLQKTESLAYLKVARPGVLRIVDAGDARIRVGDVRIAVCPRAEIVVDSAIPSYFCQGQKSEVSIKVVGMGPLSLVYYRESKGKRERFVMDGIEGSIPGTYDEQEVTIPLTLKHTSLGDHIYSLDSITDGMNNFVSLASKYSLTVLRRSSFSFRDCQGGSPASLLVSPDAFAELRIVGNGLDGLDGPWNLIVRHEETKKEEELRVRPETRVASLHARLPGTYTITKVSGQYCSGDIMSPDTCPVVLKPPPYANITWSPIHECSGDTGVTASLLLHGQPPFELSYTTRHNTKAARVQKQTFSSARGEITLQPEESGHYEYSFTKISDANYKNVPFDSPEKITQTVRPLAVAHFVHPTPNTAGRNSGIQVNSCEGSSVNIGIDLKGTPPWNVEVQIVGPKTVKLLPFKGLQKERESLNIQIPSSIDKEGGTFQVDLVSVEDAQGCRRSLSVPGVSVNVRRVKPTVKFYGTPTEREITILENEQAILPLRLTGDGPWHVQYRQPSSSSKHTARLTNPNDVLRVSQAGEYELLDVRDAHCPGTVVKQGSKYQVHWVSRPSATLVQTSGVIPMAQKDTFRKEPICSGLEDHVELDIHGRPPFQFKYKTTRQGSLSETSTFNSIQTRARFQLQTSNPGRYVYEFEQLGDALYPLTAIAHGSHSSKILRFEQDVLGRPSARFKNSERLTYCLNDAFVPTHDAPSDGTIVLTGIPPFFLELSLMNLGSGEVRKERVQLLEQEWKMSIPDFVFSTGGPHRITIDSVADDSGCSQADVDAESQTLWIDVAETAAIVPFDRRQDFCVGELLQFQLEGTPPWKITYDVDLIEYTAVAKTPQFNRRATTPGLFSIRSVAHQKNMCKTLVTGLNVAIHSLPSAQVSHGKRYLENIQEGDQAEIVFTLNGTPPFTFTYQRTALGPTDSKSPLKVLESHTVSGVTSHVYSIFSAQEGTWTVTFVADKYCRYPPSTPADPALERT